MELGLSQWLMQYGLLGFATLLNGFVLFIHMTKCDRRQDRIWPKMNRMAEDLAAIMGKLNINRKGEDK